eukprot:Rmarinus@m.17629
MLGRLRAVRQYKPSFCRLLSSTGLFGVQSLRQPDDFDKLAQNAIEKTLHLRSLALRSPDRVLSLYLVDEMSNTICKVVDLAEACRNLHQSPEFRDSATAATLKLHSFIHHLNTDVQLYECLRNTKNEDSKTNMLTEEQRRVVSLLCSDFDQHGINAGDKVLESVREVKTELDRLHLEFEYGCSEHTNRPQNVTFLRKILPERDSKFLSQHAERISDHGESVSFAVPRNVCFELFTKGTKEELRRVAYQSFHVGSRDNERVLQTIVERRAQLASLLDERSYADMKQLNMMSGAVSHVDALLAVMAANLCPSVSSTHRTISKAVTGTSVDRISAWNLSYYRNLFASRAAVKNDDVLPNANAISQTNVKFDLKAVLQTLCRISNDVFGLRVSVVPMERHEAWAQDIIKLRVTDPSAEDNASVGTIYLDLFHRQGKPFGPAHFTVRCGFNRIPALQRVTSSNSEATDPMQRALTTRQDPAVVVSMPFENKHRLSYDETKTLFHEFGHGLHSVCGCETSFQHVSGTRTEMDAVEVPSQLLENFVEDAAVLRLLAGNHSEGKLQDAVTKFRSQATEDLLQQVVLSMLDLKLFGPRPATLPSATLSNGSVVISFEDIRTRAGDTAVLPSDVERAVTDHYAPSPFVEGTNYASRFSHLSGPYGSAYYAYIWSHLISQDLWTHGFQDGCAQTRADFGLRYRKVVLGPGGAKASRDTISSLLGRDPSPAPLLRAVGVENTVCPAESIYM